MRDLEKIELEVLLDALRRRYGYDFSGYSDGFLHRRVRRRFELEGVEGIGEAVERVLHDEDFSRRLVADFSINVTEMFRDPGFFRHLREKVLPRLSGRDELRVWVAGCSTGEEVYSTAILLHEEGLLEKATIYATDLSSENVARAKEGVYPNELMREYRKNYYAAGGKGEFTSYFLADDVCSLMRSFLKERVLFSVHNLAVDGPFAEVDLILCRNVLIYFGKELKERAVSLFRESLTPGGFLCLGVRESLQTVQEFRFFTEEDPYWKVYRKREVSLPGDAPVERKVEPFRTLPERIVVAGASSGGLSVVRETLSTLSAYPFPILLVLHRHKSSSPDLVKLMSRKEGVIVVEAEDGDEMKEGVMLLAPPDYHMVINPDGLVSLSLEEPVNYARPSIDVLFASAARAFGPRVVGVLFSGASRDGVDGLKEIRARGGVTIVQDPKTAESPFMPQTAVQEEAADLVLPPEGIVEKLKEFAGGGR